MPDATTINKRVRVYLDSLGLDNVSLGVPQFNNAMWYVLVTLGDKLLGTVVLDEYGNVDTEKSYPNWA